MRNTTSSPGMLPGLGQDTSRLVGAADNADSDVPERDLPERDIPDLDLPTTATTTAELAPRPRRGRRRAVALVAIALVVGAAGATAAHAGETFNDTGGTTFESQIEWLADHGIAQGYPDGSFKPGNNVTRGAMAAYLFAYNSQFEVVQRSFSFSSTATYQEVSCPAGKDAIGGGGATSSTFMYLTDSQPTALGWAVSFRNPAGAAVTSSGTVYVICMPDKSS